MEKKRCISCGKELTNLKGSVIMPCPGCGKQEIARCFYCRRQAARYNCPECRFSGPN